jgi:hypothetical protein
MMIIRGKEKKFGVEQAPLPFCPIPHELTGLNPVLRDEKTDANDYIHCRTKYSYICASLFYIKNKFLNNVFLCNRIGLLSMQHILLSNILLTQICM